jgi:hypothetical protein
MGDHVPAFLMRELRIDAVDEASEEPGDDQPQVDAAEAANPEAVEAAPKSAARPRRRSRARAEAEVAPDAA